MLDSIEATPDDWGWHVAHVASRAEKRFAWDLRDLGVAYFLPMERVRRVSHRKREVFDRPAYPGYVFVAGDDFLIDRVRKSPKFCALIRTRGQGRIRRELATAAYAFGTRLDRVAESVAEPVAVGQKYVVKAGHALEGCYGYVDAVSGKGRVHIAITLLGASCPTEIDPEWLEPA